MDYGFASQQVLDALKRLVASFNEVFDNPTVCSSATELAIADYTMTVTVKPCADRSDGIQALIRLHIDGSQEQRKVQYHFYQHLVQRVNRSREGHYEGDNDRGLIIAVPRSARRQDGNVVFVVVREMALSN